MKIRRVGAELFHADGWTDKTTPVAAFRVFANAPDIEEEKVPKQTELTEMEFRINKTCCIVICLVCIVASFVLCVIVVG